MVPYRKFGFYRFQNERDYTLRIRRLTVISKADLWLVCVWSFQEDSTPSLFTVEANVLYNAEYTF